MPFRDGSGPYGTGHYVRGAGPCGGGRGFRRGGWFDRGHSLMPLSPEEEKAALEREKSWLEARLDAITERLHTGGLQEESS